MPRRLSCSMTIDAVKARTKTVTRRHVDTWQDLKPGDRLTLIEKGMGLPKGARQVVLTEVEIVDVRVEPIGAACTADEVRREGFDPFRMRPAAFVRFWLVGHGYLPTGGVVLLEHRDIPCRRIEWRYLDG